VPQYVRRCLTLGGCFSQRPLLAPNELLQITAEREPRLIWQIVQCRHEMDHAVPIPGDVIDLLDLAHAAAPASLCQTLVAPKYHYRLRSWKCEGSSAELERKARHADDWQGRPAWYKLSRRGVTNVSDLHALCIANDRVRLFDSSRWQPRLDPWPLHDQNGL